MSPSKRINEDQNSWLEFSWYFLTFVTFISLLSWSCSAPVGCAGPSQRDLGSLLQLSRISKGIFCSPAPPLQRESCNPRGAAFPLLITAGINCWNIFTLELQLMRCKPSRASTGCKRKKNYLNKNLMPLEELAYKLPECIQKRKKNLKVFYNSWKKGVKKKSKRTRKGSQSET